MNRDRKPIDARHARELADRRRELEWMHELAEPRRPERNRGRNDVDEAERRRLHEQAFGPIWG